MLASDTVAVAVPAVVGRNDTCTPHWPPAGSVAPLQVFTPPAGRVRALLPAIDAAPRGIATDEALVKVTTPVVAVPTVGFAKPDWLAVITDGDAMAVPVSVDADSTVPVLWISSTVASRWPTAVGVIVTWAVHDALRSERQSVVMEKSLASAPLMTTAGVARFHETLGGVGL